MIIINGEPNTQVNIDEGFDFGLGVFETIDVLCQPLFLEAHLERLNRGLERLKIGKRIEREEVLAVIHQYGFYHTALKIIVTSQNTVYKTRENNYTEDKLAKGFKLSLSLTRRNETSPLVFIKSTNYGDNHLARQEAQAEGYDDALFLNIKDQVAECSASNIFWIKNSRLYTPALESGILPGIMRAYILEHYEVTEGFFTLTDLLDSEGIFLTNSLMGIMPVCQVGDRPIQANEQIQRMVRDYRAYRSRAFSAALTMF